MKWVLAAAEAVTLAVVFVSAQRDFWPGLTGGLILSVLNGYLWWNEDRR